jgi:DNA-binding Lrp family transcriptional regulator
LNLLLPASSDLRSISKIEKLDLEIIRVLQKDARASYRDIARRIGVAVGTVQSRVKRLEESKIIRGFSVDLDYSKMGLGLTSLILVQVKGKHLREVESKLAHLANVIIVYDVTGDFDVAMVAKFAGSSDLDEFIKQMLAMDYVERSSTSIVLNSVKENHNIPI